MSSSLCSACRQRLRLLARELPARARAQRVETRRLATVRPSFGHPGATLSRPNIIAVRRQPDVESRIPRNVAFSYPSRSFTSTARRQAAVLNPRQDEDGNEMIVEITARAADRLKQIMTTDKNPDLALRITVESGGCHGFQYLMSLTDMSKVSQEDDTVFEGGEGAKIVLDEPSLDLLKGSKVDYTMELIGSQFKIVDNPYATSSCGCGTSFDIKM